MQHIKETISVFFRVPGVFMGKQQLWSAGTHGVTQHCPPTGKGENQKRGHSLVSQKEILKCDCGLSQLSEGIRVWDMAAGEKHTLLLADGDCVQPIIYYSGQQVKEEEEEVCSKEQHQWEPGKEEEQLVGGGGCTKQPVLLPFCMNVRAQQLILLPETELSSSVTVCLCHVMSLGPTLLLHRNRHFN